MKDKLLKAVSAVLLSGMILGTVITPMSAAASAAEHEHTSWTFSEESHQYTQADSWGHQNVKYGKFTCLDKSCQETWWGTLTVNEPHVVAGGKCTRCGYVIH